MSIKKKYRQMLRKKYDKKNRKRLMNSNITILSSNCIGGIIYHNLGLKFLSPTINLYFEAKDFVKFIKNLEYYISLCPKGYYDDNRHYPVLLIDDLKIYCVHYKNIEDAISKWEQRKKRINYKNIYVIMSEKDGCTYDDLIEFDKIDNYKNKVVFTYKKYPDIKSSFFNSHFADKSNNSKLSDLTRYINPFSGKKVFEYFDYVSFFNSGVNDK